MKERSVIDIVTVWLETKSYKTSEEINGERRDVITTQVSESAGIVRDLSKPDNTEKSRKSYINMKVLCVCARQKLCGYS